MKTKLHYWIRHQFFPNGWISRDQIGKTDIMVNEVLIIE